MTNQSSYEDRVQRCAHITEQPEGVNERNGQWVLALLSFMQNTQVLCRTAVHFRLLKQFWVVLWQTLVLTGKLLFVPCICSVPWNESVWPHCILQCYVELWLSPKEFFFLNEVWIFFVSISTPSTLPSTICCFEHPSIKFTNKNEFHTQVAMEAFLLNVLIPF